MPFKSPFPDLDIPKTDLLSFLFPPEKTPSTEPLWMDSQDPALSLSPAQLLDYVKKLASGLSKLGVKKGEVVMVLTPNHVFVPVALLGIIGGGYAFSGANPAYTVPELIHQLKTTKAGILLTHPSLLRNALAAAKAVSHPSNRIFLFSDSETQAQDGISDWRSLLHTPSPLPTLTPTQSMTTVATVNFSSGTTGLPKGVCVSHYNIIANILQTIHALYSHHTTPLTERWLGFLPLYHAYGQLWSISIAIRLNTPVYIMKTFVYTDFLSTIQKYRITNLTVAPPVLVMLSKRLETKDYDLSSVKGALCGAAPLSKELQTDVSKRMGIQINQGWGMTELTCGGIWVPGDIDDHSGSIGCLGPNAEAKLVDDEGKEVAAGESGEMWFRGPQVSLGYLDNEEATREAIDEEGWLKTGDVARADERGWFWLVDRKKELIKVNAFQVAPAELEAVLLEHEHIVLVFTGFHLHNPADAAVTGITLSSLECPRAYVVLQESGKAHLKPNDIQDWIKTKVAKHKYLTGGVTFVDEVPKLASGKIQRKVMREWAKRDAEILEGIEVKANL